MHRRARPDRRNETRQTERTKGLAVGDERVMQLKRKRKAKKRAKRERESKREERKGREKERERDRKKIEVWCGNVPFVFSNYLNGGAPCGLVYTCMRACVRDRERR